MISSCNSTPFTFTFALASFALDGLLRQETIERERLVGVEVDLGVSLKKYKKVNNVVKKVRF